MHHDGTALFHSRQLCCMIIPDEGCGHTSRSFEKSVNRLALDSYSGSKNVTGLRHIWRDGQWNLRQVGNDTDSEKAPDIYRRNQLWSTCPAPTLATLKRTVNGQVGTDSSFKQESTDCCESSVFFLLPFTVTRCSVHAD